VEKLNFANDNAIWMKVHQHIRERILSGEIAPNERLIEAKIAKDIGTSRTPVREALHNMQKEGLIESMPRIGYRVKPISEAEVIQICKIRAVLETLAAAWAIENAQKTLLKELKENIAASEDTIARGDTNKFVELDAQFHEAIARLSGSNHILEITLLMRSHMLRYRIKSFHYMDVAVRALKGHKMILKAVKKADAEEVGEQIHFDRGDPGRLS
jgi:DNA-binding GntR family transcriptional regulator